jgi:hypothetical protein
MLALSLRLRKWLAYLIHAPLACQSSQGVLLRNPMSETTTMTRRAILKAGAVTGLAAVAAPLISHASVLVDSHLERWILRNDLVERSFALGEKGRFVTERFALLSLEWEFISAAERRKKLVGEFAFTGMAKPATNWNFAW